MAYKPNSIEWLEENTCGCGCGHGSGEQHTDWCSWKKVERHAHLSRAAAEFLAAPGMFKTRVQGTMMSRDQVATELLAR